MAADCWFNLPDGEIADELEVTVPVKGRVKIDAKSIKHFDEFRDYVIESMTKQKWILHGTLPEMMRSCITGYERIASDALAGAESVRDDMIVMMRAMLIVVQSILGDHLNHSQKNERLRALMTVVEMNIKALRDEKFRFHGTTWNRCPDLFQWKERDRDLRETIDKLKSELSSVREQLSENPKPDDDVLF